MNGVNYTACVRELNRWKLIGKELQQPRRLRVFTF
jgi:hypothetical protein